MKKQHEPLTPSAMRGNCPACCASWQGESFYEVYRQEYISEGVDIDNDELLQKALRDSIAKTHKQTHVSLLINVVTSKIDIYVCPACGATFKSDKK